jgi:L-ascorbate metabolism protein UlaG (beta-lactamase superfamily)
LELERLDDYQSWSVRCGGQRFVVDPWLVDDIEIGANGRWLRRRHEAPVVLRPRDVGPRDILVLTSPHGDHAHVPTLRALDRNVRVVGAAPAIRLARALGFRSTIALGPGHRVVLEGRAALTAIRPRFPYGLTSIGVLFEDLDEGVRTYLETHLAPPRHPLLEPAVDAIVAPVERASLAGIQVAMDVDEAIELARHLRARWLVATGTAPGAATGLVPERLLRVAGDADAFEAAAGLRIGQGRGRILAPGETLVVPPRRRRGPAQTQELPRIAV